MACAILRLYGYQCDRLSHNELMMSVGSIHTGNLISGKYKLLWISTPADWYVRLPHKRAGPHWQKIRDLMHKAKELKMDIILFGPPGYLWKLAPVRDAIQDLQLNLTRMRLCHFKLKFNNQEPKPSGSYMQVATTRHISTKAWMCNCKVNIDQHVLDWYGHTARHGSWRQEVLARMTTDLIKTLYGRGDSTTTSCDRGSAIYSGIYLTMFEHTNKDVQTFVTTKTLGSDAPSWDQVVRRTTCN